MEVRHVEINLLLYYILIDRWLIWIFSLSIIPAYFLHDVLTTLEQSKHITSSRLKGKLALISNGFDSNILKGKMEKYDDCLDGVQDTATNGYEIKPSRLFSDFTFRLIDFYLLQLWFAFGPSSNGIHVIVQ